MKAVTLGQLIIAAVSVTAGVGIGVALRVVLGHLRQRASARPWAGDVLLLGLLQGLAVPLATLGGIWVALGELPLRPRWHSLGEAVVSAVLVLVATLIIARLVAEGTRAAMVRRTGGGVAATIFVNIARLAVLVVGMLFLLSNLGVSVGPLLTALGVGGLAVALALQDTLANLFAGVHLLASKQVQVGDFIRLDSGEEGQIVDINWRNTTVQQVQSNHAIIPNAKLAQSVIVNYFRPRPEMSVVIPVGVSYDSDLDHVERVTCEVGAEVMREVTGGVTSHSPVVRFVKFGDSSIDLNVVLRTTEFTQQYVIVSEFVKRLHTRYRREGIDVPFPMRTLVFARDGETPDHHAGRREADIRLPS